MDGKAYTTKQWLRQLSKLSEWFGKFCKQHPFVKTAYMKGKMLNFPLYHVPNQIMPGHDPIFAWSYRFRWLLFWISASIIGRIIDDKAGPVHKDALLWRHLLLLFVKLVLSPIAKKKILCLISPCKDTIMIWHACDHSIMCYVYDTRWRCHCNGTAIFKRHVTYIIIDKIL